MTVILLKNCDQSRGGKGKEIEQLAKFMILKLMLIECVFVYESKFIYFLSQKKIIHDESV